MSCLCFRCNLFLIDPVLDGTSTSCAACFPDGVPNTFARAYMGLVQGTCAQCEWYGVLSDKGAHERQCKILCDACGIEWTPEHDSVCPNAMVTYPCCSALGMRAAELTHTVECDFGCGPIICRSSKAHNSIGSKMHRVAHLALKRKFEEKPEKPRRKQAGELPSRFSVNTSMDHMLQYLQEGGAEPVKGLKLLEKIRDIFDHSVYVKNVTDTMLKALVEQLVALITDVYALDPSLENHVCTSLEILAKNEFTPFKATMGQMLTDVMEALPAPMFRRVHDAFFSVVMNVVPVKVFPSLMGLLDSNPKVVKTGIFFRVLSTYLKEHKELILESFPRVAEIIKSSPVGIGEGFLHELVQADTVRLCFKAGLVDFLAANQAVRTLHKVADYNPGLLVNVLHLLNDYVLLAKVSDAQRS